MADVQYFLRFGSGDPLSTSGLSPTFTTWVTSAGATTPPSISEIASTGLFTFAYDPVTPISFVADGATSGLEDAVRYVVGAIGPQDSFYQQGPTLGGGFTALGTEFSAIAVGFTAQGAEFSGIAAGFTTLGTEFSAMAVGFTSVGADTATLTAFGVTIYGGITQLLGGVSNIETFIGTTASAFGDNVTDPVDLYGYAKRISEFLEGDTTYTKSTGVLVTQDRTGATTIASQTVVDNGSTITKS